MGKERFIKQTENWVKDFVIKHNLCPFAAKPVLRKQVKFEVFEQESFSSWTDIFLQSIQELEQGHQFTTAIMILPWLNEDFGAYLDVLAFSQDILEEAGLDDRFQLASFHPKYQFAETQEKDVSNKTNQSPHALIHILNVQEMAQAIEQHDGDTEDIPTRNIQLMERLFKEN